MKKNLPLKSFFRNKANIRIEHFLQSKISRSGTIYRILKNAKFYFNNKTNQANVLIWKQNTHTYIHALEKHSHRRGSEFFFIQVGANDGIMDDPIRPQVERYPWNGIFIEPQKDIFEILKYNYRGETFKNRFIFENAAIASNDGTMSLYRCETDEFDGMATGLASFVLTSHLRAFEAKGKLHIEEVKTITPKTLLKSHGVSVIDLLQIDTEGFDYEIIKLFQPDTLIKPVIIHFEHRHFDNQTYSECITYLSSIGYEILPMQWDTAALLKSVFYTLP